MEIPGEAKVKVYRASDAPARPLAGETVAVLGYGNLGRTAALNLRDSGVKVRVGNQEDEYAERARAEGFEVVPLVAAAAADVVFVLLPDEVIPAVFDREIAPGTPARKRHRLCSGYSLAFDLIHPPDIRRRAPGGAAHGRVSARARYVAGTGFWGCVSVEADRSGRAQQRMLGLAEALGVLRVGGDPDERSGRSGARSLRGADRRRSSRHGDHDRLRGRS